jgi:hypothetical protein
MLFFVICLTLSSAMADSVIKFPAGGAADLLNQKTAPAGVTPMSTRAPVDVSTTCTEGGATYRPDEPAYERCMRNVAIRNAPGAPQGVPGSSQSSSGITIKTH